MRNLVQNARTLLKFVAVVAILVVVNVFAARLDVQWDMTEADLYSITERSRRIVRNVEEPLTLRLFHTPRTGRSGFDVDRLRTLLRQYARAGEAVSFEEVDQTLNPGLAREHGVSQNNVVLLQSGNRTTKLGPTDLLKFTGPRRRQRQFRGESAITTALLKMTRATDRTVHFARGHGEHSTESTRGRSVSQWSSALGEEGYATESFNPLTSDAPDTRDMIVLLNPTKSYSDGVVDRLREWNRKGGNLLVAVGPATVQSLNGLFEGTGMVFERRQIIDTERRVRSLQSLVNPFVFAPELAAHPVLGGLREQGYAVRMGRSAPVSLESDTAEELLGTSNEAISKPLTGEKVSTSYNLGTDERGSFTVGALREGDGRRGHLLAFGSPTLFEDAYFGQSPGNESLALNLVNWAFDRNVSLGIQPTPADYNRVTVTAGQSLALQVIALFVIPLGIVLWGGWVWWNRKNR